MAASVRGASANSVGQLCEPRPIGVGLGTAWIDGKDRPGGPVPLIRGRSLRMIDDENFDRALGRCEFQPELFL